MNKEQLIALGLTEEQADKVIAGFGQMIPKSRLDEKIQEVKDLNNQIKDRDKQLEELKKVDAEGLQQKIDDLQEENKKTKMDYETKLKDTQLTSALKLALASKVHDTDLVTGLIDKTKIELGEDGNISKGLDDQIKTLKESKSFLFVSETKPNGIKGATPPGGDPTNPNNNPPDNFGKKLAEEAAKGNKGLEEARKSYFE
ncbi:phage scaffolding protein [Schinkia azotoformans]|uniref:phage scaffolding protein n=1 Tax=Schinkia azotoformans TaxID=1454 RepID=UPI002DC05656|nr:phage scaffolding protein [Schinkia azotoformans]MEC1716616.1 phage scaffolding protein [Schinkia azotoformans]MEC1739454.1 phage scaffolding protein [Schinkia azotoformans]MEC1745476.1 phage scaffolding protein [Schinkia azotoformans]MEC1756539.1 phage scaffolding protein [Schinkia azotoformans]MEC1765806.1 phage scaffolding protein [Schinkia azotoformans]